MACDRQTLAFMILPDDTHLSQYASEPIVIHNRLRLYARVHLEEGSVGRIRPAVTDIDAIFLGAGMNRRSVRAARRGIRRRDRPAAARGATRGRLRAARSCCGRGNSRTRSVARILDPRRQRERSGVPGLRAGRAGWPRSSNPVAGGLGLRLASGVWRRMRRCNERRSARHTRAGPPTSAHRVRGRSRWNQPTATLAFTFAAVVAGWNLKGRLIDVARDRRFAARFVA